MDSTIVHICHNPRRYANDFIMSMIAALAAYNLFGNKQQATVPVGSLH